MEQSESKNKKELIKILIIAVIFIGIYLALYFYENSTGKLTELAKYITNLVVK